MPADEDDGIRVTLDGLLAARGLTVTELAERVGITNVNLSILKNQRAKAIRFSTLAALCRELDCQPGDIISYHD
jgi:putative transcriptional regulator